MGRTIGFNVIDLQVENIHHDRVYRTNVDSYQSTSSFIELCLEQQLQVNEKYSYLLNLRPNICKSWIANTRFIANNSDLIG